MSHLPYLPAQLRAYLATKTQLLHASAAFVNSISADAFSSETEALADIHATLQNLGASYGDKLPDLQRLYANQ